MDAPFTAFVFKVQANMNKAHRDRVAFARIVSGHFERGMDALHVRGRKSIKLNYPHMFFGRERLIVDEAYPGDILGLINPGLFRIGDVLSAAGPVEFHAVPRFSPEQFSRRAPGRPGRAQGLPQGGPADRRGGRGPGVLAQGRRARCPSWARWAGCSSRCSSTA